MSYDTSIADFQKSADLMQQAIDALKAREQTSDVQQTIEDLTKMREDILNKIAEVEETKQLVSHRQIFKANSWEKLTFFSIFFSPQLRSNLITKGGYSALLAEDVKIDKDAGSSTSSNEPAEKPKANDISHLIKRKKPDTSAEATSNNDASPAKKPALQT